MPLGNPSETGGLKIDIYAPREAADLVVVHDLAYLKIHNAFVAKSIDLVSHLVVYGKTLPL